MSGRGSFGWGVRLVWGLGVFRASSVCLRFGLGFAFLGLQGFIRALRL